MKTGILLIQLGSPASPKVSDVKQYLREFLSDPRLIPFQNIGWKLLLELVILPKRSPKSAEAYSSIFKDGVFPLIKYTESFVAKVSDELKEYPVSYGYIIGQGPRVSQALQELKDQGCEKIKVVPLFPQYAEATTLSAQDCLEKSLKEINWQVEWELLENFHNNPAFAEESARLLKQKWEQKSYDALIISHHGYPKSRIFDGDRYYDHCLETAFCILANCPEIPMDKVHLSFQSQFGRDAWLEPSTENTAIELAQSGCKSALVICPAFTVDNLETEEEIAIELKETFIEAGGERLDVVPCLNDDDQWCQRFANEIARPDIKIETLYCTAPAGLKIPDQGPPPEKLSPESKKTLKILFLILFIDLIGFSIIFPLLPAMLEHYTLTEAPDSLFQKVLHSLKALEGASLFSASVLFGGILSFAYSFLQFVMAPVSGALSDRFGRRPVLLISCMGLALSYAMWGFAGSFVWLLASRLLGGIMGSNITTATAVVADITSPATRSKGMAIIGIAFGLGFVLGPTIGGLSTLIDLTKIWPSLAEYGINPFSVPAFLSLIASLAAAHFVFHNLPETLPKEKRSASLQPRAEGRTANPFKLFKMDPQATPRAANWTNLVFTLAFSGAEFALTFLTLERLGYRGKENAFLFLFIGIILTLVQGGYVRRKASQIGERKMATQGLTTLIPALIIVGFAPNIWVLLVGLFLMAFGAGQITPCITALASMDIAADRQGRQLGIFRSLGSLGRTLGPLFGGALYYFASAQVTYILSALTMLLPIYLLFRLPKTVR